MLQPDAPHESRRWNPPPPLVAVVGWAVPGLGHIMVGQRVRGFTIGVTILALFVFGILVGGIRVVDPPTVLGETGNAVANILAKPWYIGQFLAGLPALYCGWIGAKYPLSHARVMEIGTLYTAVAGMLNLMAVIDASFRAAQHESESQEQESQLGESQQGEFTERDSTPAVGQEGEAS